MKKFYLFTLLSCCFFTAFSQKKAAVGLVVKAGNYTGAIPAHIRIF